MDGTVNEASRDDGRPVRCGTPDDDMMLVGGMTRLSGFGALVVLRISAGVLGMDFVLAVAFGGATVLAALGAAGLAAGRLAAGVEVLAAGLGVALTATRGVAEPLAGLAVGLLLCAGAGAGLAGFATALAVFGAGLVTGLVFAGVAFTS